MKWKREIHNRHGSKLIETYSWQRREDILLPKLREQLEDAGVIFDRVPRQTLISLLASELISWLARLLAKFLNHIKTSGLLPGELRAKARGTGEHWRTYRFLEVFDQVYDRYQQMLRNENAIDYHDQINLAARHIGEGRWESPYRYVLVDEFQDISAGRMALLEALKSSNVAYFLVGDDWQAINGFAGSDLALMSNCGVRLGHVQERTLSQTFRFADGILEPSTQFVRRNPEQTQRALKSASEAEDNGITVVFANDPANGLQLAREDVKASVRNNGHSVLVLGRYNASKNLLPSKLHGEEFSTVHSAKGREADYVVVLDLEDDKDGRWGFPSRIEDDPLLELVLPRSSGYPFAEERRLFYVAMTRARIGAYLVTDPVRPSEFVEELLRDSGDDLRQLGELSPECPRCFQGRLVHQQGRKRLHCSNLPTCEQVASRCPNCNLGYALVVGNMAECSNQACEYPPIACPLCGMGILQKKAGKYGPFWGCTEYWGEPSCQYTQDIGLGTTDMRA